MHPYGVRDVERLLHLPRNTLRTLIAAGFVTPARGARNAWRFSFQDLIVLRTAQALVAARVSNRRIAKSMKELRRHLPESMPLSGLSIGAVGDRVVVREGDSRWQAESGQYLLEFGGDPAQGSLRVIERKPEAAQPHADRDWFVEALALERSDASGALVAYAKAIAADPTRLESRVNLALLLHEAGRLAEAERAYRDALGACGGQPLLLYNFGLLLEDLGRIAEAALAYDLAIRGDPALADGHYNLALLYEKLGKPRDAIRHMSQYRRLVER
ncbi:MAG: tetratricopeptide repeat protein [Pseudomonadota bacterium]|nr:tetratricopeptide repeat protein [Pseudomonadota bacterium]